uniref:peptidylprolyl isomerase n=1 Tax=Parastrongyloides trichosuri TaxID=131310 RepID=A0A0N4ZVC6_PARTI
MRLFVIYLIFILVLIQKSIQKSSEDSIPVIEIRGEGPPMSSAQIRDLEERSNGKPLDIKIEEIYKPKKCDEKIEVHDWVTFHYKGLTENGKLFDSTFNKEPVKIQMTTGMSMKGLEKGLMGMCKGQRRKILIPWRLSRKNKSKVWRLIPNEEHWMSIEVEIVNIDKWSIEKQFINLDIDNDTFITTDDLSKVAEYLKNFGKKWSNNDIDNVIAGKYFIKYFDINKDNKVDIKEYILVMQRDLNDMKKANPIKDKKGNIVGSRREPGFSWILDHNNDGYVQPQENYEADKIFEKGTLIRDPSDIVIKEEL